MTDQLHRDRWIYLGLFVLSLLFYFVLIPQQVELRSSWSGDVVFTSRTFPQLLVIVLLIVSLVGFVSTTVRLRMSDRSARSGESANTVNSIKYQLVPLYFMALVFIYALLFSKLGYIISTVLVTPIMLLSLRSRTWYHYLLLVAFAAVLFCIFRFILLVPLR